MKNEELRIIVFSLCENLLIGSAMPNSDILHSSFLILNFSLPFLSSVCIEFSYLVKLPQIWFM